MSIDINLNINLASAEILEDILRRLVTLNRMGNTIMSQISDFSVKMNAHNERMDAAVVGLSSDIAELKAKIEELQNTPGPITPEDQVLLDAIQDRAESVSDKLAALDALTAPVVPVA